MENKVEEQQGLHLIEKILVLFPCKNENQTFLEKLRPQLRRLFEIYDDFIKCELKCPFKNKDCKSTCSKDPDNFLDHQCSINDLNYFKILEGGDFWYNYLSHDGVNVRYKISPNVGLAESTPNIPNYINQTDDKESTSELFTGFDIVRYSSSEQIKDFYPLIKFKNPEDCKEGKEKVYYKLHLINSNFYKETKDKIIENGIYVDSTNSLIVCSSVIQPLESFSIDPNEDMKIESLIPNPFHSIVRNKLKSINKYEKSTSNNLTTVSTRSNKKKRIILIKSQNGEKLEKQAKKDLHYFQQKLGGQYEVILKNINNNIQDLQNYSNYFICAYSLLSDIINEFNENSNVVSISLYTQNYENCQKAKQMNFKKGCITTDLSHVFEYFQKHNYIDYKGLKQLINQTSLDIHMMIKESEINLENRSLASSINSSLILPMECKIELSPKSDYLTNFLSRMDKEIKKIFRFYLSIERELYNMLNSNCITHNKRSSKHNSIDSLLNNLGELHKTSDFSLKVCNFLNLNIIGLGKILKKWDKKFKAYYGEISLKYFIQKLGGNMNDLVYLLQFKQVDEATAIVEYLKDQIAIKFKAISKTKESIINKGEIDSIDYNLVINRNSESIIGENTMDKLKSQQEELDILLDSFKQLLHSLEVKLGNMEGESQSFRFGLKHWNSLLKYKLNLKFLGNRYIHDSISYLILSESDNLYSVKNTSFKLTEHDHLLRVRRNPTKTKKSNEYSDSESNYSRSSSFEFRTDEISFSYSHICNIRFILVCIFLHECLLYVPYGSMIVFVSRFQMPLQTSFWIFLISHFGHLLMLCLSYCTSRMSARTIVNFTYFMIYISSVLLFISNYLNSLEYIILSRLILGMTNIQRFYQKYILTFAPSTYIGDYLAIVEILRLSAIFVSCFLNYVTWVLFDYMLGEITRVKSSDPIEDIPLEYLVFLNFPVVVLVVISLLMNILSLIFVKIPRQDNFVRSQVEESNRIVFRYSNPSLNDLNVSLNNANNEDYNNTICEGSINPKTQETLTLLERTMIDDIEGKLCHFNTISKFNDMNFVKTYLREILKNESSKGSPMGRLFLNLLLNLILSRAIFESLLVMNPYKLLIMDIQSITVNCLLVSSAMIIIIVLLLLIKFKFADIINERHLALALLLLEIAIVVFMIFCNHVLIAYVICFIVLLAINCIQESVISSITSKIIPLKFGCLCLSSDNVFSISSALGKIASNLFLFIIGFAKDIFLIYYITLLVLLSLALMMILINWKSIRIRPIVKLIQRKTI